MALHAFIIWPCNHLKPQANRPQGSGGQTLNRMEKNRLCFRNYGELFNVDLDQTIYFEADDHYTNVYYSSGAHFMIPFGLSRVEAQLAALGSRGAQFRRLGRTHIVNTDFIFHVNAVRQTVVVTDTRGGSHQIKLPKATIHTLMDYLSGNATATSAGDDSH